MDYNNQDYQESEADYAVLEINIIRGELKRSTNSFLKMNPYCLVKHLKSESFIKTQKSKKGNK